MDDLDFKYGPVAIGIYRALLWLTLLIAFVSYKFLFYYIPLLLFLGLGLRPFLLKTGIYRIYHSFLSKRDEKINIEMRNGYNKRNAKKVSELEKKREKMRKALQPKDN